MAQLPLVGRLLFSAISPFDAQIYADYTLYTEEVASVTECPFGVDTTALPDDCHEVAAHPRDLHAKLDKALRR